MNRRKDWQIPKNCIIAVLPVEANERVVAVFLRFPNTACGTFVQYNLLDRHSAIGRRGIFSCNVTTRISFDSRGGIRAEDKGYSTVRKWIRAASNVGTRRDDGCGRIIHKTQCRNDTLRLPVPYAKFLVPG